MLCEQKKISSLKGHYKTTLEVQRDCNTYLAGRLLLEGTMKSS